MNRLIKDIHSQIKPDKATKTELIELIRGGRVPEVRKNTGTAVGAVAAAAAVVLMAGTFAANIAGDRLDRSPAVSITETVSVTAPEKTTSVTALAEESKKLVFDDTLQKYDSFDKNPFLTQKDIDEGLKRAILLANREIVWNGITYKAEDPYFTEAVDGSDVGRYLTYGRVTAGDTEYTAVLARAYDQSEKSKVMLGFGDDRYYSYINDSYDYSDVKYLFFSKDEYDAFEKNMLTPEQIDIIMPKLTARLEKAERSNEYDEVRTVFYSEEEYVISYEQAPDLTGYNKSDGWQMGFYLGDAPMFRDAEMYESDSSNIMFYKVSGTEKEYYFRLTPYSNVTYSISDRIFDSDGLDERKYVNSITDQEDKKRFMDCIDRAVADSGTKSVKGHRRAGGRFDYLLNAEGREYLFYWYDDSDGIKAPNMPEREDEPNFVIDDKCYRISDELALELSRMAEDAMRSMRRYRIVSRGIDGLDESMSIDGKSGCDALDEWFEECCKSAQQNENGWKVFETETDGISLGSGRGIEIHDIIDNKVIMFCPDSAIEMTDKNGTKQPCNAVICNTPCLVPESAVDELAEILRSIADGKSVAGSQKKDSGLSVRVMIDKLYDDDGEYYRNAIALDISAERKAAIIAALPGIELDGVTYIPAAEQPAALDESVPVGEATVYVSGGDSSDMVLNGCYMYKYPDGKQGLMLDIGDWAPIALVPAK